MDHMISIVKITEEDSQQLADLAVQTFLESHGHSAKPEEIKAFVSENYSAEVLKQELQDTKNIFHFISYNEQTAGYSKIIPDRPFQKSMPENVTKLERIYLLKKYYDLKLGSRLLDHNLEMAKANGQGGIWLFVWKENQRAYNFYMKKGFEVIGEHDFKISETHSNPNYVMYLDF
jgi:diamine N-acetyltransferase